MRNFQEKNRFKKIMQSKPVLAFLGITVLVFAWSVLGLVGRMRETIQNKKIAENKIEDLQKEKAELLSNMNQLKTDKGIEENIREKFAWGKDGEGMVQIVDDKNAPRTDTGKSGFFSFIKSWFK